MELDNVLALMEELAQDGTPKDMLEVLLNEFSVSIAKIIGFSELVKKEGLLESQEKDIDVVIEEAKQIYEVLKKVRKLVPN